MLLTKYPPVAISITPVTFCASSASKARVAKFLAIAEPTIKFPGFMPPPELSLVALPELGLGGAGGDVLEGEGLFT